MTKGRILLALYYSRNKMQKEAKNEAQQIIKKCPATLPWYKNTAKKFSPSFSQKHAENSQKTRRKTIKTRREFYINSACFFSLCKIIVFYHLKRQLSVLFYTARLYLVFHSVNLYSDFWLRIILHAFYQMSRTRFGWTVMQ